MAGIVDGILGAALGASTGLVGNAKLQQQTEVDEAKENRRLGREAFGIDAIPLRSREGTLHLIDFDTSLL